MMKSWQWCLFGLLILCRSLICFAGGADRAWLQPLEQGWEVRPLLDAGEKAGGYRMAGLPDGLGAYANGDGTFAILMNHELSIQKGALHRHGTRGAFVSRWVVRSRDMAVLSGADLVRHVYLWDSSQKTYLENPAVAFGRFCSADLAPVTAFFDARTGLGFDGRFLLNGEEEKGDGGRAFAHVVQGEGTGDSYELPHLGRVAWENLLALPASGTRTVVIGMDDFPGGHVYVYVGEKRRQGSPVERAGLVGGALYAVRMDGPRFSLLPLGDVVGLSGGELRARARSLGATPLLRPEDGAWDKRNANLFWFATTDKIDGLSQLFRLDFDDGFEPERGGRATVALSAKDVGAQMFDNIASDGDGRVLIEEDPGEAERLAAVWLYDPKHPGVALKLFESRPDLFMSGGPGFLTEDEEHSGIVEVTELLRAAPWFDGRRRYYLGTTQAHRKHADPEVVEYGQLWLISGPAAE